MAIIEALDYKISSDDNTIILGKFPKTKEWMPYYKHETPFAAQQHLKQLLEDPDAIQTESKGQKRGPGEKKWEVAKTNKTP
jgi:hypothetical protein